MAANSQVSYSAPYEQALAQALGLLRGRAWASGELGLKLAESFDARTVEAVVARLGELKLLDDRSFAEAYAERRATRAQLGRERILAELRAKGLDAGLAEEAVAGLSGGDERARARLALQRFLAGRDLEDPKVQAKAGRHLIGRGFEEELVRDLLDVS